MHTGEITATRGQLEGLPLTQATVAKPVSSLLPWLPLCSAPPSIFLAPTMINPFPDCCHDFHHGSTVA